ncbi:hypothetical protein B0H67DRAFT_483624 [Lasiosphaeris hirsuta]|uniref:dolichol kinase n=1 Tax=Lasiosphaeris hirsuta TaxID=260670 RepID=A0AA40AQE9_9PEZI|nr:hypothetical protein B0H67DRAFT_483624 [Lasiosphaeris hirsuta]
MPEHLQPPGPSTTSEVEGDREHLRIRSRTPKPYHRQNFELLEPSDRFIYSSDVDSAQASSYALDGPSYTKDSTPASESGTEADDEHFLKGLPAPKARLHKGLRGKNESLSGSSTPLLSPAILEEEGRKKSLGLSHGMFDRDKRGAAEKSRRRKELIRRAAEVLLLACQGGLLASNRDVQPFLRLYRRELFTLSSVCAALVAVYPLRLARWAYAHKSPAKLIPVCIPASFDPAPLLYPPLVPVFVSLLVAQGVESAVPLNVVLSICALPRPLIPGARYWEVYSSSHWLLSCTPCFLSSYFPAIQLSGGQDIPPEVLVLLYPLHQTLCLLLQHLTTTSLLIAELQLLSAALINLLLLAHSPQAIILKAVLWGGGLGVMILCGQVIQWAISLARVPKWRFQRVSLALKSGLTSRLLKHLWSLRQPRHGNRPGANDFSSDSGNSTDEYPDRQWRTSPRLSLKRPARPDGDHDMPPSPLTKDAQFSLLDPLPQISPRRHTLPVANSLGKRSKGETPSGRRKRSASFSVQAFFSLTPAQAALRRWLYAGWVYVCVFATIFIGIRGYVKQYALQGYEPVGWALGYLFGDLPRFRFEVVKANLERWICLPARPESSADVCSTGWVQHVRITSLGEANMRLALSAYWLSVIVVGLAVVFRLSPIYEVDTRRKVFHFMMVTMFLPTAFVDPTYVALALSLVLAIFLLLDLLRTSQLPPLSKPIASFLTPYVDGRDLRGPVVISHIFLLIGCAIPLWLSLAALPRTGLGTLLGWEVPTRDVSMVSGVVCVGLGDAAASLIGRRWGHRKWLWGGGKSIEGSLAFATAVFVGLMAANLWLRLGGWVLSPDGGGGNVVEPALVVGSGIGGLLAGLGSWLWWSTLVQKTALCASMASLTEAVLTGGNDNVVVPVVLWTCVKTMGV